MGDKGLFAGLELQMQVRNAGNAEVPSHRIYSGSGPVEATKRATANSPPAVALRLCATKRKEVAGPAFSAADLNRCIGGILPWRSVSTPRRTPAIL